MSGLRRHWWALCAGLLAGVILGGILFVRSTPVYESTASVLVEPVDAGPVNLQTEALLVRSTETAAAAATLTRGGELADVRPVPDTSILAIRFEAPTPAAAQAGALAYATAYLDGRARAARAIIEAKVAALTAKIADANAQLAATNARIASLPRAARDLADLHGTAATLAAQITSLTTRASDLATTTITPGRVIGSPPLPATPERPDPWLYLPASMLAGLLAGAALAVTRDRASCHVRHGLEVVRRHGLTLLLELTGEEAAPPPRRVPDPQPRPAARTTGFVALGIGPERTGPPTGAAYVDSAPVGPAPAAGTHQHGAFNRLRNEVAAALTSEDRVLVVVGASTGAASTVVAANLAAAFARADVEVVLVGANAGEIGNDAATLSHIFDVADIPGLTDVLTGRATLARAMQRAARSPRLRVVTPGGTATASGLLQSEGARGVLHALRRLARFVVVDAPSAAAGADAQSLAAGADAAIIVAEAGRTRHAELADATAQLRLVGTRVLGVALVNRAGTTIDPGSLRPPHRLRGPADLDSWVVTSRAALNAPTAALSQLETPAPAQA